IRKADALLIVSPEYNGSYPGVLKNAIDYLRPEFARKTIGLSTVSAGGFGGINCLGHLQHLFLSLGAVVVSTNFPVSKVQDTFDDKGLLDPSVEKRADRFIDDLLWFTEAFVTQRAKTSSHS
ncbi:MAG TPA: NAD(P)H-dependent oxidoreductase, partial [Spirochaetes bacterium]|nr:NAD(P)H-dependent oxidoreductase [Spirochaetota bacterium]